MSKYEAVYFVGDNQVSNRIRVDSYKTRNRGAFSGSLAALISDAIFEIEVEQTMKYWYPVPLFISPLTPASKSDTIGFTKALYLSDFQYLHFGITTYRNHVL